MSAMNDVLNDAQNVMSDNHELSRAVLHERYLNERFAAQLADKRELLQKVWLALGFRTDDIIDTDLMLLRARHHRALYEAVLKGDGARVGQLMGKGK